ncbi:MAG: amidohydrolase [Megasphaera sp.]|jgi:amidohydrolase|nr:amidohydrolase [Megasphaera sp.]MCH4217996.1 amidohydrolase [Megasphaera sp.]
MEEALWETVLAEKSELIAIRRHCHEYPELSCKEFKTIAYIEGKLDEYGISHRYIDNGGIIAWIDGEKGPGKTLLIRADIDALPIEETDTNLSVKRSCCSLNKGVMHACGHDGHIAMALVTAKILNDQRQGWPGKVVFMFEQGEEQSGPLEYLLRFLEEQSGWHIDACYATHVRWDIPAGKIAICHDAPMAGGFGFEIRINGHGGHGSRPDLAQSPIDCFHDFYSNLQSLRMRTVPPLEGLTISIGSIHSGEVLNVIPDSLTFAGTSRFFSYENAGRKFYEEFLHILQTSCDLYHCTYDILHMPPPLYEVQNNPDCVALAEQAVIQQLGADVLTTCVPWMASETFALTTRLYPGVLTFTGIANTAKGCGGNHHTPEFDLDEDGLPYGTAACLGFARNFLAQQPDITFTRTTEPLEDLIKRNI